ESILVEPTQHRPVALGGNAQQRQYQQQEPQAHADEQPGINAGAVGMFPDQRTEHGRGQLGDGGKGDLPGIGQTDGGTDQPVDNIGQQQDDEDGTAAQVEH